jgi:hypothetical protein
MCVTVGAAASAVADAVLYPWRAAKGLAGALTTDGAGVGLTCEARTGDGCMAGHYSSADALTRIPSPLRPPHTGRVMGQGAAGRPAVAASRGLEGQQGSGYYYTREEPLLELHAALGHVRASEADLHGRTRPSPTRLFGEASLRFFCKRRDAAEAGRLAPALALLVLLLAVLPAGGAWGMDVSALPSWRLANGGARPDVALCTACRRLARISTFASSSCTYVKLLASFCAAVAIAVSTS